MVMESLDRSPRILSTQTLQDTNVLSEGSLHALATGKVDSLQNLNSIKDTLVQFGHFCVARTGNNFKMELAIERAKFGWSKFIPADAIIPNLPKRIQLRKRLWAIHDIRNRFALEESANLVKIVFLLPTRNHNRVPVTEMGLKEPLADQTLQSLSNRNPAHTKTLRQDTLG